MDAAIMKDWLSISSLLWTIFRVCIVWLAFYGFGNLISELGVLHRRFKLMPATILGMLAYSLAAVILSLMGLMTRTMVSILLAAGAMYGAAVLYLRARRLLPSIRIVKISPLIVIASVVMIFIFLSDSMLAARPEINFNDTQVTYLVQADRWLNHGRMYLLDETVYSALPLVSETLLIFPSSLAADRLDQMILAQVFSLSMLLALAIASIRLLRFKWSWFPAALVSIGGCSTILVWCHFAKPDAFALYFVTVSLVMLLRQLDDSESRGDLSAFPVMGLALATKQTAYIAVIPFLFVFILLLSKVTHRKRFIAESIFLTGLIPLVFAVRTMLITGTPFYPYGPFNSMARGIWRFPHVDISYLNYNDRSSEYWPQVGFFQNIYHYFGTWNSSIFLLITGYLLTIRQKYFKRNTLILAGIGIYAAISLILFYPAWWGAKYGILLIPFSALFGMYLVRTHKRGLMIATLLSLSIYFIYDSPLSPTERWGLSFRGELMGAYVTGIWPEDSNIQMLEPQAELKATLWMNSHLPPGSTVLSFSATKRYFSNFRWINAWRYPQAMQLYADNTLDEEIRIMEDLGVNYMVVREGSPAPFDDENSIELFRHIGSSDLLRPLACLDGFEVLEFHP